MSTGRQFAAPAQVTIGIRPEHIVLAEGGLALTVNLTEQLGGNSVLYGVLAGGQPLVVQLVGQSRVTRGQVVSVHLPPEACHVFDAAGQALSN